jgi:streptomycin 6-kinase
VIFPVVQATAHDRLLRHARQWRVTVDDAFETETALVAYGRRGSQPVVLKVLTREHDEWRSGEVMEAFAGRAVARVFEYADGALLLERLSPATPLAGMALQGRDDEATEVLADVIAQMSPRSRPRSCPTVEEWGKGFDRYAAARRDEIRADLFERARSLYVELCRSQAATRLLHGDLHHYNVLHDAGRGWVAVDPKGVIGEVEYEIGAGLRNPNERPELFADARCVERRLELLASRLNIDVGRALRWAFSQAVLSAIWGMEDGYAVDATNPSLRLAEAIRPMIDGRTT